MQQDVAYYNDTYETSADTRVLATGMREGAPWVALQRCLLHPQGGGQPADRGWVNGHAVTPVRDHDTGLILAVAADGSELPTFTDDEPVTVQVDVAARREHAALHTAGHLIEAAGRAQGWALAANNHFPGQARIEFTAPAAAVDPTAPTAHPASDPNSGPSSVPMSDPDTRDPLDALATPEQREQATDALRVAVTTAINDDLPVRISYDADGSRTISLGSLHSAPCGGTHVASLGDLAQVQLATVKVKKGRIRVSYSAAHRHLQVSST